MKNIDYYDIQVYKLGIVVEHKNPLLIISNLHIFLFLVLTFTTKSKKMMKGFLNKVSSFIGMQEEEDENAPQSIVPRQDGVKILDILLN